MLSNTKVQSETDLTSVDKDKILKPYCKPQLIELGDLRTVTLGSTVPNPQFESDPTNGLYVYIP